MFKRQRIELKVEDGPLYGLSWTNEGEEQKGNIIIVTGMEETSIRYDEFAQFLCRNGYNVYCVDHYGQGENVKEDLSNRGVWPTSGFRKMVNNVDALVAVLRLSCKPIYIFAHSMGSFVLQDYIQRYPKHVSKVVLCGTGSKNPATGLGYALAKMTTNKKNREKSAKLLNKMVFGAYNKHVENPRTPFDWLSYNEENVDKYIADPLCGFGPNKGFFLEFLKGLKRLHKDKFLKRINKDLKIFLIAGKEDPVGNWGKAPDIMKNLYLKYGIKDVEAKTYPHARHEILNETNETKNQVYQDVLDFFNK